MFFSNHLLTRDLGLVNFLFDLCNLANSAQLSILFTILLLCNASWLCFLTIQKQWKRDLMWLNSCVHIVYENYLEIINAIFNHTYRRTMNNDMNILQRNWMKRFFMNIVQFMSKVCSLYVLSQQRGSCIRCNI